MSQQWYYVIGDDRHGPVTAGELKALVVGGKLRPTDLVWREGMSDWVEARSVKGLFARPTPAGPVSPDRPQASERPPGPPGPPVWEGAEGPVSLPDPDRSTRLLVGAGSVVVGLAVFFGIYLGIHRFLTGGTGSAPTMERAAFREAVMRKSPDEVLRAVGRPELTKDWGDQEMWSYRWKTIDPVTGKPDFTATLTFEDGSVKDVNF